MTTSSGSSGSSGSSAREKQLAEALAALRARLDRATAAAGRAPEEVELLPVTKFFPASDVLILRRFGMVAFGESREQEASAKIAEVARNSAPELSMPPIRWHMVGRIQRNKAKAVARWAYAAHSVDNAKLITALNRGVEQALEDQLRTEPLRVFLQISLDGDDRRGGVDIGRPELVDELCAAVRSAAGLELTGLMGIPPLGADVDEAFARLAAERDRVQRDHAQRLELSAGMSEDLETAVRHGSTCVRVGTALLGPRPLTSPEVVTPVTPSSQTPPITRASEGSRDEHTP
ncbi:YggS family pyridoxal phosphate-dependent enzyme [Mycolicibacterium thermoresistibile]